MNKENLLLDVYYWQIAGLMPDDQEVRLGVQAESMEFAMEAIRQEYPNIRFIHCYQGGEVNIIVE